jgi:hypothetical protein
MPHALWIDDKPVTASNLAAIFNYVVQHPTIVESARAIRTCAVPTQIAPEQPAVYVFQKEFAVLPRSKSCLVGSDRATTCHILIALSRERVLCAHLDGSQGQISAMISALCDCFRDDAVLDLHLAGGFLDNGGLSIALGRDLLAALARGLAGSRLNLKTAYIGPLNTSARAPVVRALAINTRTGDVIPNSWFEDRGPHIEWRAARASYGASPLVRVTDPATGEYWLDPTDTISVPDRRYMEELLKLDDRTLLQMTSTSPEVEHDTFCDETRATLRYLLTLGESVT